MSAILGTLRISNGKNFDDIVYPKTKVSQIVDLLDDNNKILLKHFPGFIFGGQTFFDSLSYDTSFVNLLTSLGEGAAGVGITAKDINMFAGRYFQATTTITITNASKAVTDADTILYQMIGNQPGTIHFNCDNEAGDVTVEANDYIVFTGLSYQFEEYTANFSIINNTYGDASTTAKGIVTLAKEDEITTGNNNTKAVTPKGAKLAVETFGYTHPTYTSSISPLGNLKAITSITTKNGHVTSVTTADIQTASFGSKGVVQLVTDEQAKVPDLTVYAEHYAVSPQIAKNMIDYWGGISVFKNLSDANGSSVKSVTDKLVLVKD